MCAVCFVFVDRPRTRSQPTNRFFESWKTNREIIQEELERERERVCVRKAALDAAPSSNHAIDSHLSRLQEFGEQIMQIIVQRIDACKYPDLLDELQEVCLIRRGKYLKEGGQEGKRRDERGRRRRRRLQRRG